PPPPFPSLLCNETAYYLMDTLTNEKIYYHQVNPEFTERLRNDIKEWYQAKMRCKYEEYFAPSLRIVKEALKELDEDSRFSFRVRKGANFTIQSDQYEFGVRADKQGVNPSFK